MITDWSAELDRHVASICGPFDESDEVNHDPDSCVGEEDESGFDEMPLEAGWEDESDEEDDDDGEEEE